MTGDRVRTTWAMRSTVVAILLIGMLGCDARDILSAKLSRFEQVTKNDEPFFRARKSDWTPEEDCAVHKVEHVHLVMDRVCLMCHEMFSHQHSTLRFECRRNCFDNTWFRKCLNIFTAPDPKEKKVRGGK